MAYYYSASERAFFSSELMSTDAMPSDKVAVADQAYKQLMADQVAGKLIRTGSGNAPESVDQGLTAATRFGDVSFGKVTGTSLDINGNGDVSVTLQAGGAVTIKGSLNAQGGLNVTSITATGTSTLAAVNATNLSLSGTLKVNGASTLQAVSAKKVTATELDLNGNDCHGDGKHDERRSARRNVKCALNEAVGKSSRNAPYLRKLYVLVGQQLIEHFGRYLGLRKIWSVAQARKHCAFGIPVERPVGKNCRHLLESRVLADFSGHGTL